MNHHPHINAPFEMLTEDITIDIFSESMMQYLQKLNAASEGRYELDDYDLQVLAIVMEQYAKYIRKAW